MLKLSALYINFQANKTSTSECGCSLIWFSGSKKFVNPYDSLTPCHIANTQKMPPSPTHSFKYITHHWCHHKSLSRLLILFCFFFVSASNEMKFCPWSKLIKNKRATAWPNGQKGLRTKKFQPSTELRKPLTATKNPIGHAHSLHAMHIAQSPILVNYTFLRSFYTAMSKDCIAAIWSTVFRSYCLHPHPVPWQLYLWHPP